MDINVKESQSLLVAIYKDIGVLELMRRIGLFSE